MSVNRKQHALFSAVYGLRVNTTVNQKRFTIRCGVNRKQQGTLKGIYARATVYGVCVPKAAAPTSPNR